MAGSTKQIKRRIKSIANTKKITKAMELVAGAKMRRAVEAVLKSRQFATLAMEMVSRVRRSTMSSRPNGGNEALVGHELFNTSKQSGRALVVVISSDRGLCGSFNTQLFRKLESSLLNLKKITPELEFVAVGKRAAQFIKRQNWELKAFFQNVSVKNSRQIDPVGDMALKGFLAGNYDRIYVAYTDFRSALRQVPSVITLLPLEVPHKELGEARPNSPAGELAVGQVGDKSDVLFEPSPMEVLNHILPKIFETELYQTVLESAASEHSARMMAMRTATDSAAELLDDLVFTYNKIRQGGITKEIIEVSTGASLVS